VVDPGQRMLGGRRRVDAKHSDARPGTRRRVPVASHLLACPHASPPRRTAGPSHACRPRHPEPQGKHVGGGSSFLRCAWARFFAARRRSARPVQVNRTRAGYTWFALTAWVSLPCIASCLSGDEAPAGGRVEHPPRRTPMPVSSAERAQNGGPPPPGGPFSSLDQAIAGDCYWGSRAWSQNVPDRDCTHDTECGDGFCDRGHCAAVRTCAERYGQRCVNGRTAPNRWGSRERCSGICLDGRCRSCESNAECNNYDGTSGPVCGVRLSGAGRACAAPWRDRPFNLPAPSQ
jgi:hypothetical protein